jgi:PIN domain nuclease of toxin-antitoxin system
MIVLDTHVLVWLTEGGDQLGPHARDLADEALGHGRLWVSAISFWEVGMLHIKGRVRMRQPLSAWRRELLDVGLTELQVTGDIGITAVELREFHPDPVDRLIVATASLRRARLLTADERILAWDGPLHSIDARA